MERNFGEYGYLDYTKTFELLAKRGKRVQYLVDNGINKRTVQKLKRNECVNAETICKLCVLLECVPQKLFTYIPPEKEK